MIGFLCVLGGLMVLIILGLLRDPPRIRPEEELQQFLTNPSRIRLVRVRGVSEVEAANRVWSQARSRGRSAMPRNGGRISRSLKREKKTRAAFRLGRERRLLIVVGRVSGSAVIQITRDVDDQHSLTLFFQGGGLTFYQGNLSEVLRRGYPSFKGTATVNVRWASGLLRRLNAEMESTS